MLRFLVPDLEISTFLGIMGSGNQIPNSDVSMRLERTLYTMWKSMRFHFSRVPSLTTFVLAACMCIFGDAYGQETSKPSKAELREAQAANGPQALSLYEALLKKYPNSNLLYFEYGNAYYQEQQYALALKAYERARALGTKSAALLSRMGKCHAKVKQYPQAESAYRQALALEPENHVAQFGLGSTLYSQDKSAEALACFEKLVTRNDDWGTYAKEYLALCCHDLKQYDRAIGLLKELIEKAPKDSGLHWTLAKSLYKAKRYEEALPHLEQAAVQNAEIAEAAEYYRANALFSLGRIKQAEQAYQKLATGNSEWAKAAREIKENISGKPYRIYLDYLGGYDTGLVQSGDDSVSIGEKDFFNQIYMLVEGRVYRGEHMNMWLGGEHFGLHYPDLHDNDYFENSAKAAFNFPNVGPFSEVSLKYHFKYAQLDYQPYLREHEVQIQATYKDSLSRLRAGIHYGENDYFRTSEGLTGPDARFFFDYRRRLPLWDHQLRLRGNVDYRWSELESSERFTQRFRVRYEATLWKELSAFVEATYRRDDYPESQSGAHGVKLRHRTDQRLKGEVRFEYQLHRHLSMNWGYQYESQDSRREDQEYGRHQFDAGFTVSF